MGLDMYLMKKTYVKNWKSTPENERHTIIVKKGNEVREDIDQDRVSYIVEDVAYWRKFNALHNWFGKLCRDKDQHDESNFTLSSDDLKNLLETLNEVKNSLDKSNKKIIQVENGWSFKDGVKKALMADVEVYENTEIAHNLLPTQDGFFFGSTLYDEYYYSQVKDSIFILEKILNGDNKDADYIYQASW